MSLSSNSERLNVSKTHLGFNSQIANSSIQLLHLRTMEQSKGPRLGGVRCGVEHCRAAHPSSAQVLVNCLPRGLGSKSFPMGQSIGAERGDGWVGGVEWGGVGVGVSFGDQFKWPGRRARSNPFIPRKPAFLRNS